MMTREKKLHYPHFYGGMRNPDHGRPLFSLKPLMLSLVRSIVGHPCYKSHNFAAMEQLNMAELWQEHQSI